jgi:hypothetical protein
MTLNCLHYELNSELTMQFQLPQSLQTELLAYDPKLKALARQATPKKDTKKAKHPHGNVNDLIPIDVVRFSLQQDAVDLINSNPANARYHAFTKLVDVATPQAHTLTYAVLYHYEQCWYAAWLPPKGKEQDYVYGYAIAFKDTAAASKTVPGNFWRERETYETKQYGRTMFYTKTELVTKQDIINGNTRRNWCAPCVGSYYQKSRDLSVVLKRFEESLFATIPSWEDGKTFERLQTTHIHQLMGFPTSLTLNFADNWVPTLDSVFEKVEQLRPLTGPENAYALSDWRKFIAVKHILDTPFFRRWIQQKYTDAINAFNDPETKRKKDVTKHFGVVFLLAEKIYYVTKIWPDCPLDFIQSNIDELLGTAFREHNSGYARANEWLRQHMPVASFFQMLRKFYEKAKADYEIRHHSYAITEYGIHVFSFHEWSDTTSMMERVLTKLEETNEKLTPPKRWRIEEFHDYIQAESWKILNPNEGLPQDLFPEPTKVQLDGQTWTFFQPHDTHQLAMWGQAVRNCVGSASHYAEDCKKKKHFLVLCMLDGKPQFTIQLIVEMGMMSVKQIVGLSNKRLEEEQKSQYTKAFGLALQSREAALKS